MCMCRAGRTVVSTLLDTLVIFHTTSFRKYTNLNDMQINVERKLRHINELGRFLSPYSYHFCINGTGHRH